MKMFSKFCSVFAVWNKVYGEELYDHLLDDSENENLSTSDEYHDIKMQLRDMLEQKNGHVSTICRITAKHRKKAAAFC